MYIAPLQFFSHFHRYMTQTPMLSNSISVVRDRQNEICLEKRAWHNFKAHSDIFSSGLLYTSDLLLCFINWLMRQIRITILILHQSLTSSHTHAKLGKHTLRINMLPQLCLKENSGVLHGFAS